MMKRIIALILTVTVCLQCTACTVAQDVLYEMGINVDFEEAWEQIQTDWNNIKDQLSSDIQSTVADIISFLDNAFGGHELPDTAVPVEGSNYYLDFPLEKVTLPASNKTVFLMPLYGYGKISVYSTSDNTETSISNAGITFNLDSSKNKFTIDEYGTICGRQAGMGMLSVSFSDEGAAGQNIQTIPIFVAECDFSESDTYYTFSDEEKEYIITCLDLSYTLYKAQETSSTIEWNAWNCILFNINWDDILLNINNLSDNLSAAINPFTTIEETRVKKVFSDFFKKYVEEHLTKVDNSDDDWEKIKQAINGALLLANNINLKNPTGKFEEAVAEFVALYQAISTRIATSDEYKRLTELLNVIYSDIDSYKQYISTEAGRDELSQILRDYEPLHKVVQKFQFKMSSNSWQEFINKAFYTKDGKLNKLSVATEAITLGINLFDAVSYTLYDYDENIRYLQVLRDGLNEYKATLPASDDSVDLEIKYIESLIDDYTNKYAEAAVNFIFDFLAQATELVAGISPIYSVTKFVATIIASQSNASTKEKATVLSLYASGAFHTLDPIHDLYLNGKISTDYSELRYRVSLYLNLMLEINKTILDAASGGDKKVINENIKYIENTLAIYLDLD